jgi:hypothetical protein
LQTAGISLQELGAKFGDEVAIDFEHALQAKTSNRLAHERGSKENFVENESIDLTKGDK